MSYLAGHGTRTTPQRERARADQITNSEGGYVFAVDSFSRLRRFLILGSEGGSYYAGQRKLTTANVKALGECLVADGPRAVDEIRTISQAGRAPKNDPAVFALAYAVAEGDDETKRLALDALPDVCRTSTHLFMFAFFLEHSFGKLTGRAKRRAIANWYARMDVEKLAYQAIKYRQREGFTHRDLLRLSHPARRVSSGNPTVNVSAEHAALFNWIVSRGTQGVPMGNLPSIITGYLLAAKAETPKETAALVREYRLPREALVTDHLTSVDVWRAMLDRGMPLTAMIRNLGNMTRHGVLEPMDDWTNLVASQLTDQESLRRARVHPLNVLSALRTYQSGGGHRSENTWTPLREIIDALDKAFYLSFGNVEPTGKRFLLALDVSGSMTGGEVGGVPGLSPRDASAAMALVTAATETNYQVVGFTSASNRTRWNEAALTPLDISPRQRLNDAIRTVSDLPFGGTDCALPMIYAQEKGLKVDAFVIYTDSETWAGNVQPFQALREYRKSSGIDARLVVVGMVAEGFTIADPTDPGMLDVVGFDTATPNVISDFAAGRI